MVVTTVMAGAMGRQRRSTEINLAAGSQNYDGRQPELFLPQSDPLIHLLHILLDTRDDCFTNHDNKIAIEVLNGFRNKCGCRQPDLFVRQKDSCNHYL